MRKILVQNLVQPTERTHSAETVAVAIADRLRSTGNECAFVCIAVATAADIDVSFVEHIADPVVISVDVEAPATVQARFDYVVTVHRGDLALRALMPAVPTANHHIATAPRTPPPSPGGILHRLLKYRPFGRHVSV
ncbi:hypothetical protein AB4Y40_30105 [Paraburkholderia sp. EG287B]|uniref:hypothetical protein n=1 Tax=Paraburkholderia sp. EG287B TaxID=3237010 RepID=UPI0034D1D8B8